MVYRSNFLTIKTWEPKLCLKAQCDTIAIWARLLELPFEFYDEDILIKIGNALGKVLKIDAHTNDILRG